MQATRGAMLTAALLTVLVQGTKLHFDVAEAKKRPTTKVVELLKGMSEQLESEGKTDEETYDKFKCWCDENTASKTKAAAEAEEAAKVLKARVTVLVAKSERLVAEVQKAEDEVQKNTAALDTATALRKQQNQEYTDDVKRIGGDLESVKSASVSLGAGGSFLQISAAKPVLQQIMSKYFDKMSSRDRETLQSFLLQESGDSDPSGAAGVLTGLTDSMNADLETVEADEAKNTKDYDELSAAKKAEISAGIKQIESKKEDKAAADEERAHKKQEIKDLIASVGADLEFVDQVKAQCADMDAQYGERTKTRAEETEAISKAIETLNADEAHEAFAKTFSFLQESSDSSSDKRRQAASAVLSDAGKKHDARLTTLALKTKIDNFDKVKKAMDEMVAALKKESEDEVEQKGYCIKSFQENELAAEDKTRIKVQLTAKEESAALAIKKMADDLKSMNSEVEEMQKQLKVASQNREDENKEFQEVIPEQHQTKILLKQALDVLGKFYNQQGGALIQVHSQLKVDQPKAPEGFKDYKANGQSFGVMKMIQQLIADTDAQEAEATRAEQSAQKAYETFAKETTASIEVQQKAIADKTAEKARTEKTHVQTRQTREGTESELDGLATTKAQLHESCDFLMTNFDARQSARQEELESITKAKQILGGATFAEIQLD